MFSFLTGNAAVNLQEWRGKGHKYTDVPDSVKDQLQARPLTFNTSFTKKITPYHTTPLLDFPLSNLPEAGDPRYLNFPPSFAFFSADTPNARDEDIQSIPMPPKGLLAQLSSQSGQMYLDGMLSICVPTTPLLLPLATLRYWMTVHSL